MKYAVKLSKCLLRIVIMMVCLVVLNGCQRYACWLKTVFNQGNNNQKISLKPATSYIRSLRMYDQVNTLCNFDILFLDVPVLTTLKRLRAYLNDNTEQQISKNNYINFYVLAPTINGLLTDSMSQWHIFLDIDGLVFKPVQIKAITLGNEYKIIFGELFNRYKKAYSVQFNRCDQVGNMLLENAQQMTLHFRKLDKQAGVTWFIKCSEYQEFNKNRLAYDIAV